MRNLTATICLTIAVLLGNAGMGWSADFQKGYAAYKSGDYATALREWRPLARQGNADAQFNLGWMYEKGRGVPQDDKTAVKWYRLAAEQGNAVAQQYLRTLLKSPRYAKALKKEKTRGERKRLREICSGFGFKDGSKDYRGTLLMNNDDECLLSSKAGMFQRLDEIITTEKKKNKI
jgi:hypothetical protein